MSFRIGITIGDVVERDGDLLGDGVNIAARLEGLAEVGGICISRAVHEQVANKLSVQFADIGAQEVKNIPTPVHAYMVAMRREDGTYSRAAIEEEARVPRGCAELDVAGGGDGGVLVAIGVGGFLYFTKLELSERPPQGAPQASNICRARHRRPRRRRHTAPSPPAPPAPPPVRRVKSSRPKPCRSSAIGSAQSWRNEYAADGRSQGVALNVTGSNRVCRRPAKRRSRQKRRARTVPETRGRQSVAAKMRNLRRRQHGGLSAWPAADAAVALDQARSLDREAIRIEGNAAGARHRQGAGSRAVMCRPEKPNRSRSVQAGNIFFNPRLTNVEKSVRRNLESCGGLSACPA